MKVSRSVCLVTLTLAAILFQTDKFIAHAATVPPGACLYALDPTADRAFQIAGAQSVYTACGVVSESSASDGFEMEGSETLYLQNHAQVSVVGGAQLNGQTYLVDTISNQQVQAVKTTSPGDPLASTTAPTTGTIVSKSPAYFDMNSKPANNTLSPGVYCGGLTIGNTNGTAFTMSPGVYIMAGGGLVLNSQAVVNGSGVTVYNTSSAGWGCSSSYNYTPITISGQVTATLSAPTTGALNGILFFGNRAGCSTKGSCVDQINGGSTTVFNGALYFASDEIEITGSNASGYMMLVADKIYINGNSTFGNNGNPFDGITVSVSPSTTTLFSGQTQQFTATVNNSANPAVTWTINPTGVGSIGSTGLYTAPSSVTALQTVTITATSQADTSKSATATVTLEVTKSTPAITWANPGAITYGTALSSAQLDATASVAGTFVYTPAAGTVLAAGSQTLSVTFTPTNTTSYNTATATITLPVNKATPTIAWATPAAITYGTPLSATQLAATTSVAGTFAYTPPVGTVLAVGSQTLSVTFTPTNTANYNTATAVVPLIVNQASQTISFTAASSMTYGVTPISLSATASSGLSVTFSMVSGPGSITGSTLTITGTGTVVVAANQAGNASYAAAAQVTQSIVVTQAVLTVTAGNASRAYGAANPSFTDTVTGFVNGDTSSVVSGSPTLTTTATSTSAVGTYPITATAGTLSAANYSFTFAAGTLTITQANTGIVCSPVAITYGTPLSLTQLNCTSGGVTGNFVLTPAVGTVLPAGVQSISVSFTPSDSTDYETATASVSLSVNKATPVITWPTPAAITYGTALSATQLDATSGVSGTFAYTPAAGTVLTAGLQTLSVTFTPNDTTDYTTATATSILTVNKTTPAINWPTPAAITYGTALSSTQLNASSTVAGTLTYSPAAGTVLTAGPQSLNVTFTPTDIADYTTATATVMLTVNKATPTITWPTPAAITYGTALSATQLDATTSVAGTFAYTPTAGTVLAAGSQTLTATFTPTDTADYTTATATVAITVNQSVLTVTANNASRAYGAANPTFTDTITGFVNGDAASVVSGTASLSTTATSTSAEGTYPITAAAGTLSAGNYSFSFIAGTLTITSATQTINFTALASPMTYGVPPIALSATSTSGLAVSFSVVSGPATVSGSTFTITGPGTVVVAADQAGNSDYSAAAEATQTIVVNIAPSFTELASSLNPSTYGQNVSFSALVSTGGVSPTGSISFTDNGTGISSEVVTPVQTTNLVAYSQTNAAVWSSDETGSAAPIVAADSGLDPFGGTNALQMAFPASGARTSDSFSTVKVSGAFAGQTFTASVWLSAPVGTTVNLLLNEVGGSNASASNAVTVGTAWQRFSVSLPIPAADSGASSLNLVLVNPSGQPAATINVFGAQVENATSEGPYVATYGTARSGNGAIASFVSSTLTPGSHPIVAAYSGDSNDAASTSATLTQVVNDASATLSLSASANAVVFSTPVTFTANILNSLTGTVTFYDGSTAIGAGALNGGGATLTTSALTAGSHVVTAAWVGNADYNSATSAPITLLVNQAMPTISWASPAAITYGTALSATQLNATTNVAGTFVYTPATGTVLPAGAQILSATFTPTDTMDFTASTVTVALAVNQATPAITWATPAAVPAGTALSATQLDATANVAGTFTYAPAAGTVMTAGTQALSATFTPTDTTDFTTATATVALTVNNLLVSVTVTPTSATLYGGQTQQFTASVANTSTLAVKWTLGSGGLGTISTTGLYTAPATISTQQTVTVTATSQADSTQSASATVTLTPAQCASNGYGYERAITIDHTQVPNTDQANFPFLFNTIDPLLASTANGGHVANLNGYDIIFTSDPAGQNVLNYEMEEYNPVNGQVIAWVRIPTLSHTSDTVLYVFYGNSSINTSQQNPTGVWDANYMGVWHVANNGGQLSLVDSTSNGNNASNNGATTTVGQIDGGMQTNGSTSATIGTPATLANLAQGNATFSAWVNTASGTGGMMIGNESNGASAGWGLGLDAYNNIDFEALYSDGSLELTSSGPANSAAWSYVTVTLSGATSSAASQATLYVNGMWSATGSGGGGGTPMVVRRTAISSTSAITDDDSAQPVYLANGVISNGSVIAPLNGSSDEFRISNVMRSPDWISTEYNNQSSPGAFYAVSPENVSIAPPSVTLYSSQSQQFENALPILCSTSVTWSLSSNAPGTLTTDGLYTAPSSITTQQTVVVTATSQANSNDTASATVTLMPPVAASVTPATATLTNGSQQQQLTATVINTSNTAVVWTMSPSSVGTIDQTGLYTAPSSITSEQTVTITATSQFDTTKWGSATITLTPPTLPAPICASNGYSFMRAIVVNHNLVPNTDQANFPFLFNSTDPAFATTGNGGHMANENAYDLIFATDPAGQNVLNYELEEYNSVTGQVIAWVKVPNLSHTTDTMLYIFYGNDSIASSQQNPTAVWDSSYMGVWHVANPNGQLSLTDSTRNGDNATDNGATATAGEIDGGMATSGGTYATIGAPANLANLAHGNATFSAWVNPSTNGGIILGKGGFYWGGWTLQLNNKNQLQLLVYDSTSDQYYYSSLSSFSIGSGWSYVTATISQSSSNPKQSQISFYVNGLPSGTGSITINNPADDTSTPAYLANNYSAIYFGGGSGSVVGAEDEFRISNIARSADWITTEYNNQSSPSSFYGIYPENFVGSVPLTATLYASQTEQFANSPQCGAPLANWSMPAGSPGTLTTGGLYTAPSSIAAQQNVSITATSQANGSTIGTSMVTLSPPVSVSMSPTAPTLYVPGETLQFSATVSNAILNGVIWTVSTNPCCLAGIITASGLYTVPFFDEPQTITVTATSVQDPTKSASSTLTLIPLVLNPSGGTIYGGFKLQFTASVPVVWSIGPGGIGTIDQTGLYTAPSNGNTEGQYFPIVATVQSDPNASVSASVQVKPPIVQPVTPTPVSLYSGQSQSFNVCFATSATSYGCPEWGQLVAIWSISPAGAGVFTPSGVYTAPASIPTSQTVTVTATDISNPSLVSTGIITLIPPSVSVTPKSVTLYPEQKQQFTAVVTNSSNTAVNWSISPSGVGSINSSGVYIAPFNIGSQQTVTVTASSQSTPSVTASAVITLLPAQCPAKAYSYVRPIVIDHTKVPSSDQPNFPFYFAVTDPSLASTGNGGHVASPTGNDIVFSSDPAGLQPLPFDLEQYNPATGQIVAWVQVPVLSHSQDTVIYMFYGSSSITLPQQNSAGVWDANYAAVYQFEGLQNGTLLDSTINGNNASSNNVQETPGQPDAAGGFDGATSYINLPSNDFASFPSLIDQADNGGIFNSSFAVWFKTKSSGVILGQTDGTAPNGYASGSIPALYIDTSGYLRANFSFLEDAQQIVSPTSLNDNNWHYAVFTFDTNATQNTLGWYGAVNSSTSGIETLYVDGQAIGSESGVIPDGYNSVYSYFLGTGYRGTWGSPAYGNNFWFYFNGSLDEVEVSSVARSSGWVQAEYNNQSSPSTFLALGAEAGVAPSLNPLAVTLYQGQSQQFTVLQTGLCKAGDAVWSMPSGSPGTLSPTGLYSSPSTINSQQIVTVTATTLGANFTALNATITLMPPVAVTVLPGVVSLPAGGTQQFAVTVSNATNAGVTWSLNPVGVGSISPTGLYTAPSTLNGQQTVSVIATSLADPTQSASATVTLGVATAPASTISINPQTAMLYAGQTQQFASMVTNTTNTAVAWSLSPAGSGSIDANGLYTAPITISTQQTVIVTATSQANSAVTVTATIELTPMQCVSSGYSYLRAITIDHTKIPNTDQTNFPFLFSVTDPQLTTTANGGHVTNPNGYDIIFTSDPAGQSSLNYEMEEYNPATGQVIAWVQIPTLSHTTDTTIYLFYGNSNITTSQQNAAGTWDRYYGGVWHLSGNGTTVSAADSTANANNATLIGSASVAPGEIGNSAFLNLSSYFDAGNQPTVEPTHAGTMSVWVNSNEFTTGYESVPIGNQSFLGSSILIYGNGQTSSGQPQLIITDRSTNFNGAGGGNLNSNQWYYLTGSWDGSFVNFYVNGALVGNATQTIDSIPSTDLYLGIGVIGNIQEARVSGIGRSADWIAAEYANQSSPSTFFALSSEDGTGIAPVSTVLYANQSQQFNSPALCSAGVSWSLSSGAQGSLTSNGLFKAPSAITEQQTLTVTATSQASTGQSASATVTLMPPVSVTVAPASITLNQNQTQQFTATVNNSTNPSATWTMSPAGLGSLDQNGGYIAPSSIIMQQTVTITAVSVTDPTKSASAMVTLTPSTCASTGYGYQRVIVIDHTKVANTDQINYPFLFHSTDSDLASVDNGGHVANPNGYDIIFSTDPKGQTRLDFEVEQYNPATGQLVAWMRVPTLSHSSDTVIYVFYGNPAITTSQANPAGVWDSNYQAVYHLGNLPATWIAADSTSYVNNASYYFATAAPGQIDGAVSLDGAISYLEIPSTAFPNYPTGVYSNIGVDSTWQNTSFDATYSIWFKTSSWGGLLDQTAGETCLMCGWGVYEYGPEQPGDNPTGSWGSLLDINFDGYLEGRSVGPSTQVYNDNNWHYATITFENGVNNLYADGQLVGSGGGITYGFAANYAYFVGTEDAESDTSSLDFQPWKYLPGQIDEINVSSIARSGDWIRTQFNNQSSPATFYKFYSPSAIQVAPSAISLYAAQSELFVVPGTCDATIAWSLPAGSPGTLTPVGLYTAPSVVSSQQTVTVSAMSQSNGSSLGSAQVTLLPAPQPLTLVASSPSPYEVGSSQSFTATLLDLQGNPRIGITVNFTVAGPNETVGTATTSATGTASFSYTGSTSGTDTIQATAGVDGALLTSNSDIAAWLTPPPAQAPTVSLLPQPSPGRGALVGAFTDNNGDLIEPIVVGTAARAFITPAGATRLQLGINDTYFEDNGGVGFVVAVNGVSVTVPPTAMPWNWQTGGLNNNYQYGINDGSSPVIAAARLTAGQPVTVAYQSGSISTNYPLSPLVNASGDSNYITGTQVYEGAYFPTLYTTGTAYPQNLPINVFAAVVDASGAPIPNTPVTLTVSGANPGQYQATTDATGAASFLYTGQYAGNDNLQAQAAFSVPGTLTSNQTTIAWTNYPTPPPVGSLSLNYILSVVNSQSFSSFARDASGNALPNVNVGFYVTGIDDFQSSSSTNNIGQAGFNYYHTQSGSYRIIAVDSVDRNVIVTPAYTGTWTVPTGTQTSTGPVITISISASPTDTMPNALQLNGTVTDNSGLTPTVTWTQVSGPGTVTFANPNQPATTATFNQVGAYVLQLSASDTFNSGSVQFAVAVVLPSVASETQGWIGSPVNGSAVSGLVPITLAPKVALTSGTLSYYPTNNPNSVTVLNANVSGTGQIGVLDTTTLANGSYWIQMQATDTQGNSEYSLVLVSVTGNYKPGRLTTTVTDLVVPSSGLAINIQRSYDSLNANTSGDFGYGWNLGINADLTVDPLGNVTFTLGGIRRTFYLTPRELCSGICFPYYSSVFTPEPGLNGTLSDNGSNCAISLLIPDGSLWGCLGGTTSGSNQYTPVGYVYTDPSGTQYTMSAGGQLQSIQDKNGNGLTITANGITSTTGLNVPFVRDNLNRITQITDPQGNIYSYQYDTNGNLASVTYPNTPQSSIYTYDQNHNYLSGTDFRGYPLPITAYYGPGDTDPNGLPLNGRVKSGTDATGQTTSYAYNLATNATILTYPQDPAEGNGQPDIATIVYNNHGDVLTLTDPLGNTTTHTYDSNYNLLSTTDPLGHTTTYTYDSNGNQTSTTYPATATSTTSYTNYNQYSEPTSTTDELGNTRTFNYDANYNPASVTDSLGTVMSAQCNTNGTMAASAVGYDITQAPAKASQFTYDANGNLVSKTDALGRTTSYTYSALGQKLTMTEPVPSGSSAAAATTSYTYDVFGHLTQIQAPLGRTTSSTYDGNGNKTSDTDARGNTTRYTYDALNRLVETDYADGTKATRTYDFRNNVVTDTDQGGHVTLHQYDLAGRKVSVTQAYGTANATTTTTTYDAAGRVTTQTDSLGHVTNTTYDAAGNIISATMGYGTASASTTSYTYDNARDQISMTDGNGNTTKYQYDARKRLTVTTYPDQTSETGAYDGPGHLVLTTDQAGNQVQYNYDAASQQVSVIQVNSPNSPANANIYGYDADGNVITSEDANSHTTTQSFDLLGEQTSTTLPDGKLTEARAYDSNGNLVTVTHFNGATTTYTYDALNRLLSRSTPSEPTVSHSYTATGQYATTTDASGTTTYNYDNMDRITAKVTPEGTLSYTYDAVGNVASIASSNMNGASMSYTYDDLNRLATVTDNRTGGETTYSYDSASNLATVTYPNGVQSTFTYDTLNRVTGLSSQPASYTYQRGPAGNLLNATESTGRQVNWTYDGIYRLTDESIANDPSNNDGSIGYTLDPVGNRTSESSALPHIPSGSWSFNADDEISGKSYDQNGNVTSLGGKSFTYNSQNQMIAMTASGTSVAMIYDGFGNRVAKTGNGATTQYLVEDDKNPTGMPQVFDELTNGVVTRTYAYGLQRIAEDQVIDGAWTPSYFGYDEGGSVRNLTGASGVVTDQYEYDAFGNSFTVSGTTPNNYLYRGEQHDPDLGLYYLRTRYYNPLSGRFTGVDPLTDQGQPRYEYAGADPVNGIDPMGTEDMIECALLGAHGLGCPFIFPVMTSPIPPTPTWCNIFTGYAGSGESSKCSHWTVRVNYRPILSGKKGCDENLGIPSCSSLPFGWAEHTYVEIDGPEGNHTWGVLGVKEPKWDNQEMVKDYLGNFQDPLYTAPGIQTRVLQATDQDAKRFMDALDSHVNEPYPNCPSCGLNYHNFFIKPRRDLVSLFTAYNSNTFTWNSVKNAGLTPPTHIGNAPGYHSSPRYGSYPF